MISDNRCSKSELLFGSRSDLHTVVKYCHMNNSTGKKWLLILSVLFVANDINAQIPAGAQPAPTNIRSTDCPCILPDQRVLFKVNAPDAGKVQLDLGKLYEMQKDDKGTWTVTTDRQEAGFHYYSVVIDGFKFADPASESFYGTGRMSSAIDIPETGVDFYTIKNVPHGEIRAATYFSKTMANWRNLNIYTPPGYDKNTKTTYPVLYIQHGGGEDERGWAVQGKTNTILDNLIAEGKAVPMIIVMANGNVTKPGAGSPGYSNEAMTAFKDELAGSVIPFIESNYRVKAGVANRAISGLSMGGGQAFYTGLRNLDLFSHIGVFSTGLFGGISRQPNAPAFDPEAAIPGILTRPQSFNSQLKVFYISVGEQDPRIEPTKKLIETFKIKGVNVQFNSFPGGHEWQVWRKSLHDFAQRLFK